MPQLEKFTLEKLPSELISLSTIIHKT